MDLFVSLSSTCFLRRVQVQRRCFAIVRWLSIPEYLYSPNPLVVRVHEIEQEDLQRVIPIEDIEPTQVAVMPDLDGVHFFMLRSTGVDRMNVSV